MPVFHRPRKKKKKNPQFLHPLIQFPQTPARESGLFPEARSVQPRKWNYSPAQCFNKAATELLSACLHHMAARGVEKGIPLLPAE